MRNRARKIIARLQRILLNSVLQDQSIAADKGDCFAMVYSTYESHPDRMTELATNYQNSLQYEDIPNCKSQH
ncbi:hypothetical protein SCLCIDRAFT_1210162 [Scleroderma citrinum Foug A]|uniref:Uncharacterized protein n=1 Tax=Scleroderma citrinum Foug A TaxID=1036808 RepID=A0A0C3ARC6_9AGAM|nr:hypothetical protein SCLCIDRAFT_1210162 [Scleroderma citrinum Foug A]